jgi:hypothetical protein
LVTMNGHNRGDWIVAATRAHPLTLSGRFLRYVPRTAIDPVPTRSCSGINIRVGFRRGATLERQAGAGASRDRHVVPYGPGAACVTGDGGGRVGVRVTRSGRGHGLGRVMSESCPSHIHIRVMPESYPSQILRRHCGAQLHATQHEPCLPDSDGIRWTRMD